MAKEQFKTISIEKRKRILEAAKIEFSERSYFDASINKIIERAEISRGSFYLYFKDKRDIYIETINESKIRMTKDIFGDFKFEKLNDLPLLIFDYYTTKMPPEDKKLIKNIITDINVENHGQVFKNLANTKSPVKEEIYKKCNDKRMVDAIIEMLMMIITTSLADVYIKHKSLKTAKENLKQKIQLLFNGIDKELK